MDRAIALVHQENSHGDRSLENNRIYTLYSSVETRQQARRIVEYHENGNGLAESKYARKSRIMS